MVEKGILLEEGWRYHPGDNPAWAQPAFDDSRWDTINPTRRTQVLPPNVRTGIIWLRLRFRVSDSLRRYLLMLVVSQAVASELYLNGQLLRRSGTVSSLPEEVRAVSNNLDPVVLPALPPGEQVLAVRMAVQPARTMLSGGLGEKFFVVRVVDVPEFSQRLQRYATSRLGYTIVFSVALLLTLLHLTFLRYNPSRRANLYFALYAACMAGYFLLVVFVRPTQDGVAAYGYLSVFQNFLLFQGMLWAARALYALFDFRLQWTFWALCAGALLSLLVETLAVFEPINTGAIFNILLVLTTMEQLRITVRAVRQGKRGAGIVAVGFATTVVFLLLFFAAQVAYTGPSSAVVRTVLLLTWTLSTPLGISLFLAREFALDSQLLQLKLTEVEQLSAQTLAQEQEKQALLARQNEMLEQQVRHRTAELEHSLHHLKTTQAQLIQAEKMASLGELTAGIAHEIQNPLNFVNNFAELSAELVQELADEQHRPARDPEVETELMGDLKQNLEKITHHGQRAASIVKGMLEHSRTSTGERQPTDLNALADEYLRLAYHGLRAKDKSFNATLVTDFDPALGPVAVVPQELGRVLLNLLTNAFYALRQRQRLGESGYQPTVTITTKRLENAAEICVRDNGTGIPESVKAKIFQPFFTTKPTGEGTGLGLSLSYDIVTKGHGGTLAVHTHEGEGTEITMRLPA